MIDPHLRPSIAVSYETPALYDRALELAGELDLPLLANPNDAKPACLLVFTKQRLELQLLDPAGNGPVYADFVSGAMGYRRRFGGGRRQPLAKAVGLKGGANPVVLDATAGLGRDAFVLACLGCTVHLVERSAIITALLRDGLARAGHDAELGSLVVERLRLSMADSRTLMAEMAEERRPDIVYLDPMYPQLPKTALVKKEMRVLRRIVGEDSDAPALLAAALHCARRRVVVKRSSRASVLEGPEPTMQIAAENTRFDVYLLI